MICVIRAALRTLQSPQPAPMCTLAASLGVRCAHHDVNRVRPSSPKGSPRTPYWERAEIWKFGGAVGDLPPESEIVNPRHHRLPGFYLAVRSPESRCRSNRLGSFVRQNRDVGGLRPLLVPSVWSSSHRRYGGPAGKPASAEAGAYLFSLGLRRRTYRVEGSVKARPRQPARALTGTRQP